MKDWARMPSAWLRDKSDPEKLVLPKMSWTGPRRSDQIAALMLYIVLVQHAQDTYTPGSKLQVGEVELTYNELSDKTGLSRPKVSGGLTTLIQMGVIQKVSTGRNNRFRIVAYDNGTGWAKLPARGLYGQSRLLRAFKDFTLRSKKELNALRLYLLIAAFRDNETNHTAMKYETFEFYTGVPLNEIKSALSLLVVNGLVLTDTVKSPKDPDTYMHVYRLPHLEPYKHKGTVEPAAMSQLVAQVS